MDDGSSSQGHAGHAPAAQDPPGGAEETSVWPLAAAAGVVTVYVGVGLVALSTGASAVISLLPGGVVLPAGIALVTFGLLGWVYHGFVWEYWTRAVDPESRLGLRTGMVLFIGTELATFGGLFAYYFYIRARPWPLESVPHLLGWLIAVNTGLLLASSVTLHLAHDALEAGDHTRFERLLGITILLGLVFLAGQAYEYYEFVVREGFTLVSGIFGSAFFGLTGLHGLHVSLGVVLLSIVFVRARFLDHYSPTRDASVSTVSMYWHFVDAVWVVLVLTLYLGGSLPYP